jgi:hypothetical protein
VEERQLVQGADLYCLVMAGEIDGWATIEMMRWAREVTVKGKPCRRIYVSRLRRSLPPLR